MNSFSRKFIFLMVNLVAACENKKELAISATPSSLKEEKSTLPAHRDEAEHAELPTQLRLAEDVVQAAGIKTALVTSEILPLTVDLSGEIALDPDHAAEIAVRVPGRIVEVYFKEGSYVKAGQVLAVLESPDLARARATSTSATAHAKAAQQNVERLQHLAEKNLVSGQEIANAQAQAEATKAEALAARQVVMAFGPDTAAKPEDAARLTLHSPISGFVMARNAVRGQTFNSEQVIAKIGNLERANFMGRVFEKDLARIQIGADADVRLNAYPNEVFTGRVETVGKQLDPAARTVLARVVVNDHGNLLKAGLFGSAKVVVDKNAGEPARLVVPLSSLTKIAGQDVVFVLHNDGDYEVHRVTLGRTAAGKAEVLSGLRPGERIVVAGTFMLKGAILKSTFSEEE